MFFTNLLIPDILESKRNAPQVILSKKYLMLNNLKIQNGHQKKIQSFLFYFKCVLKYLHSQVASQSQCLSWAH